MTTKAEVPPWYLYKDRDGDLHLGRASNKKVVIAPRGNVPRGQEGAGHLIVRCLPHTLCVSLEVFRVAGGLTTVRALLDEVNVAMIK